jgi:hypothetical protein
MRLRVKPLKFNIDNDNVVVMIEGLVEPLVSFLGPNGRALTDEP